MPRLTLVAVISVFLVLASPAGRAAAAPPNDDFAAATPIPSAPPLLPFTNIVATAGWTTEPGEPLPAPACDGAFGVTGTAWYAFTPSTSGFYNFDTFGSTFDTVLSVYDGGPFPALTLLACNNDGYHFPQANRSLLVTNLQSSVGLALTAGTTYYIQVGGNNGAGDNAVDTLTFHALFSYYAPVTGAPCVQDHAADTNGNGYSDADESTPNPAQCGIPYPMPGGFGINPVMIGAPVGCCTDPILARNDIDLDGLVNGLDLGLFAANFGKTWRTASPQSTSPIAESDFNGDYNVDGLDLNQLAKRFALSVPANCGGGGVPQCSAPALRITVLPPGGCATATTTLNADGTDTVWFFWDRAAGAGHVLNLVGAGCPAPLIAGSLPMPVGTPSGQVQVLVTGPPPASCFAQFDATPLWP